MDATTLPTLLLGGDPQGDPARHVRRVGQGARACRPCAASSSGARCCSRRTATSPRRSTSRRSWCTASARGTMTGSDPRGSCRAGTARRDGCDVRRRRHASRAGSTPACGSSRLDAGERWSVDEPGLGVRRRPPGRCRVGGRAPTRAGRRTRPALPGRASVFAGPTDVAYVPAGVAASRSPARRPGRRIAICAARVPRRVAAPPFRHVAAAEVPVELRGAGSCSREVRNFGVPGVLDADSIIACEVVTPAGNWSSYPPHKHDEERDGVETELEEIYYFEITGRGRRRGDRARRPGRLPAGLRHRRAARSTSRRGAHRATSSSCRTAGTARRWPRPATTCTTST